MPNIEKIRVDGTDYDLVAPEIYDGTERVIGTWFGEPLYRQVFRSDINTSGQNTILSNISNIIPVRIDGYYSRTDDICVEPIGQYRGTNGNHISRVIYNTENGLFIQSGSTYQSGVFKGIVILEYIKITNNNQE